jgi:hypothetical protein
MRRKGERCVRRYEHNYFRGWCVEVKRGGRKVATRYFRDEAGRGGREAAKAKAMAYRDEAVAMAGPPTKVKSRYARSTTGHVGVSLCRDRDRRGVEMVRYRATWPTVVGSGARRVAGCSFSVKKYGKAEAKRLAIEAREAGVARYVADGGLDAALGERVGNRRGGR